MVTKDAEKEENDVLKIGKNTLIGLGVVLFGGILLGFALKKLLDYGKNYSPGFMPYMFYPPMAHQGPMDHLGMPSSIPMVEKYTNPLETVYPGYSQNIVKSNDGVMVDKSNGDVFLDDPCVYEQWVVKRDKRGHIIDMYKYDSDYGYYTR